MYAFNACLRGIRRPGEKSPGRSHHHKKTVAGLASRSRCNRTFAQKGLATPFASPNVRRCDVAKTRIGDQLILSM